MLIRILFAVCAVVVLAGTSRAESIDWAKDAKTGNFYPIISSINGIKVIDCRATVSKDK